MSALGRPAASELRSEEPEAHEGLLEFSCDERRFYENDSQT